MIFIRTRFIMLLAIMLIPLTGWGYDLASQVTEFKLDNGMEWLLVRRTGAPVFSGIVMVQVGGMDEVKGKTGLAHMFEHMAFKGSKRMGTKDFEKEKPILDKIETVGDTLTKEQRAPKPDARKIEELLKELAKLEHEADAYRLRNEVWELLVRNGGADLNAYTSKDVTAYHASMPANQLELWARVTAEMVFEPAYREFYTERKVVAEERRSNTESDPDGALSEKILSTAYQSGPYHWSTIGYEEDIRGLTLADAREFHARYYVPSNMVGVLVGDFTIGHARKIISQAFGGYAATPAPERTNDSGQKRGGVSERLSFNAEPSVAIAYHKPTLPNSAEYTFDIITTLLCEGRSSRLEKRLIYEKRIAREVSCTDSYPASKLENLLLIWIEPIKGRSVKEVEREVEAEIARLKSEPVGKEELSRAQNIATANLMFNLEKSDGLAHELAHFQSIFGDWRLLADYPKRASEVTALDIIQVSKKYLIGPNRVIVERSRR